MSILKNNTFETGLAAGTTLTPANSGGAAGNAFTAVTAGQGSSVAVASGSIHGASARFLTAGATGASAYVAWDDSASALGGVFIRAYVQFKKFHSSNVTIITARGTETTGGYQLRVTSAGVLQLVQVSGSVVLATGATAMTLNTWYRVELYVDRTGAWGLRCQLGDGYVPLFPEQGGTGATSGMAGNFTVLRLGLEGTAVNAELFLDDVAYGNDWVGPVATGESSAVAIAAQDPGWTAVGSGTIAEAVSDASNSTYAQSPALTGAYQPIQLRLGALAAGDVTVRVRLGGDSLPDARIRLLQGTTVVATWTSLNLPTGGADYEYTLTAAQAALITDRSALVLEIAGIL